jgi:hypothetical protein
VKLVNLGTFGFSFETNLVQWHEFAVERQSITHLSGVVHGVVEEFRRSQTQCGIAIVITRSETQDRQHCIIDMLTVTIQLSHLSLNEADIKRDNSASLMTSLMDESSISTLGRNGLG